MFFTGEGDVNECLRTKTKNDKDGSVKSLHSYLIRKMIEKNPGMTSTKTKETSEMPSATLSKDVDRKPRKETCSYHSVVGMINFIDQSTHLETSHAVL